MEILCDVHLKLLVSFVSVACLSILLRYEAKFISTINIIYLFVYLYLE